MFLRVSAVLGGDPKVLVYLMVLLITSFNFDRGFTFHSRLLSLCCVMLVRDITVSVIPDSLFPDDEGLDGFLYLGLPFECCIYSDYVEEEKLI